MRDDCERQTNRNDLGKYTAPRRWNDLTIMCYERGCVCRGCEFSKGFSDNSKCQVKASVLEMVRVFGVPYERKNVILSEVIGE